MIKIFAPATVANVGSGFDILGFALEAPGDIIEMEKTLEKGIVISEIESQVDLSCDVDKNTAGVALKAMMDDLNVNFGVRLKIIKGVNPGSGTGSSAASSAGAVFALNQLLENKLSTKELVKYAMKGEKVASGSEHADNVAPSLLGGFVLTRDKAAKDIIKLPVPDGLTALVVHPQIEVKTSDSRSILKKQIDLSTAISQWGNVASLVASLYEGDLKLLGRSMEDHVIVKTRSMLIPFYDEMKEIAMDNGALGFSISGSGPSVFALVESKSKAKEISEKIKIFLNEIKLDHRIYISKIGIDGCRRLGV